MIERAIAAGPAIWAPEDIRKLCLKGDAQIWIWCSPAVTAMCVTRIVEWPKAKVCTIELCAGEGVREFVLGIEAITVWAKDMGCRYINAGGRSGWEKLLGWKAYRNCWKEL